MGLDAPAAAATPIRPSPAAAIVVFAGVTAALAFLLDITTGGWEMIIIAIPLVGLCITHFLIQRRTAHKVAVWSAWTIAAFALADLVLLEVILLQVHEGDGPKWVTISALLSGGGGNNVTSPPAWDPGVLLGTFVLLAWGLLIAPSLVRRRLVRGLSVLLLAGVCVGLAVPIAIIGGDELRASAAAAQTQKAQEEAHAKALGPAPPTNCGGAAVPVHDAIKGSIWEDQAPAVGRAPVWVHPDQLSIEKGRAVLHLGQVYQLERGPSGWKVFVTWLSDAKFSDVIHVTFTDAGSGAAVTADPSVPMPDPALLDPAHGHVVSLPGVPPYSIYVETLEIPGPGCYAIKATWPADSWTVIMAVGK
jgi:hypothetical protein